MPSEKTPSGLLPSGADVFFGVWASGAFKLNQPKKGALDYFSFPWKSTGHLRCSWQLLASTLKLRSCR